jgi:hypothetical protein
VYTCVCGVSGRKHGEEEEGRKKRQEFEGLYSFRHSQLMLRTGHGTRASLLIVVLVYFMMSAYGLRPS